MRGASGDRLTTQAKNQGSWCTLQQAYRTHASTRWLDTIVEEYNTGDVDLHQMVADFAGITRKEAKTVNLGNYVRNGRG